MARTITLPSGRTATGEPGYEILDLTEQETKQAVQKATELGYSQPDKEELYQALLLSSEDAAKGVQQKFDSLNKMSAPPPKVEVPKEQPKIEDKDTSNLTLINPETQQTVNFDSRFADINKENIQSYLSRGYQLAEGENPPAWLSPTGIIPEDPKLEREKREADEAKIQRDEAVNNLRRFDVSQDPALVSQLNAIEQTWNTRIAEMAEINRRSRESFKTLGIRIGARFTGGVESGVFGGVITESERQGAARIAELEALKQNALAGARNAHTKQKWSEFVSLVELAEDNYDQQLSEVEKLQKVQAEQAEKFKEESQRILRESSVIGLVGSGITDPVDIFRNLGGIVSFKDITDITDKLVKQKNEASGDVGQWLDALEFGAVPEGTSFADYLGLMNPGRELDLVKKGLDIQKISRDLAQGVSEFSPKQISSAIQLTNSLKAQPMYIDMLDISTGLQGVQTGLSQQNGFGDITAINAFQRMVDPGATVRAEDVELLRSASAVVQKFIDTDTGKISDFYLERATRGSFLPDVVRRQMAKVAKDLYERRASNYNNTVGQQYKNLSVGANIPFEMVGQDFPIVVPNIVMGTAFDDEEKANALNDILLGEDVVIEENKEGFWDSLLGVFGLQAK